MINILLIDDEVRMLDLLELYLTPMGYKCIKATSGKEGIKLLRETDFDLVMLDIMMPHMDGWETCRQIRSLSNVPVIMLTARNEKIDVVKGLKGGADDYITKPFNEEELLARIEAVLRRTGRQHHIEFNNIIWDNVKHIALVNGKNIRLTPIEFSLLGLFLQNQNNILSRDQLIERIWGYDSETDYRTVDSHIRNLREKLRNAKFPINDYLATVYGIGYRWISD